MKAKRLNIARSKECIHSDPGGGRCKCHPPQTDELSLLKFPIPSRASLEGLGSTPMVWIEHFREPECSRLP